MALACRRPWPWPYIYRTCREARPGLARGGQEDWVDEECTRVAMRRETPFASRLHGLCVTAQHVRAASLLAWVGGEDTAFAPNL
jgi:hypothetical protein